MSAKVIDLFSGQEVIDTDEGEVAVVEVMDAIAGLEQEIQYLDQYETVEQFWIGIRNIKAAAAELPSGP